MRLLGPARYSRAWRLACGRLALACALALLPLPLHALAGRVAATATDTTTQSMGSPVPLIIVEGSARVPAPTFGLQLMLPPAPSRFAGRRPAAPIAAPPQSPRAHAGDRLIGIGRLLLDGG
ncbi:MAG TPA: hypothetical protein PKN52_06095 [Trueperaceae bacterium]|nr:hypothetical protein [Trueperaceae bacterium]